MQLVAMIGSKSKKKRKKNMGSDQGSPVGYSRCRKRFKETGGNLV